MLLIAEGFEGQEASDGNNPHYGPYNHNYYNNGSSLIATGTESGKCRRINENALSNAYYFNIFFPRQTHLIVGFYFYYSGSTTTGGLCSFRALSSISGYDYIMGCVTLDAGRIKISYNNSTTNYAASGSLLSASTWYHIEVKLMLDAQGSIEVRVNGVTDCTAIGINTNYNNVGFISYIQFVSVATYTYIDDVIIMNLAGNEFNDWLGPVYIKRLVGTTNGTYNEFLLNGSYTKDQLVQQTSRPSNSSNFCHAFKPLNQSVDLRQSFYVQTLTTEYQVIAVIQAIFCLGRMTVNTSITPFVKNDVDVVTGSFGTMMGRSSWHWESVFYTKAPDGGSWTVSKLNTSEFGVRFMEN